MVVFLIYRRKKFSMFIDFTFRCLNSTIRKYQSIRAFLVTYTMIKVLNFLQFFLLIILKITATVVVIIIFLKIINIKVFLLGIRILILDDWTILREDEVLLLLILLFQKMKKLFMIIYSLLTVLTVFIHELFI